MIREVIVTSRSPDGESHIAPMGIHVTGADRLLMPFKPSRTLDNVLATGVAVMNFTDDVRGFCRLSDRSPRLAAGAGVTTDCLRLAGALAHAELRLLRHEDDPLRPRLHCRVVHEGNHAPFRGFNRAQFAVLEAAILVSRLHMLPTEKIEAELAYLRTGLDKTAGAAEREAWGWLMERIEQHRRGSP